jgi:hypothetical protein
MATLETQKPRNYLKLADLRFFLKRKCGKKCCGIDSRVERVPEALAVG